MKNPAFIALAAVLLSFGCAATSRAADNTQSLLPGTSALHVGKSGKKTYGPNILKPAALKACIRLNQENSADNVKIKAEKSKLDADAANLNSQKPAIVTSEDEINADGKKLQDMQTDLKKKKADLDQQMQDANSQDGMTLQVGIKKDFKKQQADLNAEAAAFNAAVTAYNQKTADYRTAAKDYQDKAGAHNDQAAALNHELSALQDSLNRFNEQCAGSSFYDDDMLAVTAEIAKEDKAGGQTPSP